MTDELRLPEPPDLTATVFEAVEEKAGLPGSSQMILGILAGVYIGFGGLFALVALAGAEALPWGVGQLMAGLVFALGLALVLIGGAELFTGNALMAGPVVARRLPLATAAKALCIVYVANFLGSLLLALLVLASGAHEAGNGAVARAATEMGASKTEKGLLATFASGILANMLVCLAVWLAYAGKTVIDRFFGLLLPIAAFVAAGLEHSVANMFLLPYALLVQGSGGEAAAAVTLTGIAANLVPATLGNLVGGAAVALAYGHVHVKRAAS